MNIIFFAILKLFVIVFLGYCLYKKNVLKEEALRFLTTFVINIAIPSLIFSNIVNNFVPALMPGPWIFIVISVVIFSLGLFLGFLGSFRMPGELRREFVALISFQNCGYLPMNIVIFLLPSDVRSQFLTYIFLYLLGFNILMWSVASFFIFNRREDKFAIKSLLSPPSLSVALSLLVVYLGLGKFIPSIIITPIQMVGETSFVLSMVILGAWLAKCSSQVYSGNFVSARIVLLKLVVLPLVVFFIIYKFQFYSLLGFFILLEATMPSAASLPIVADMHRGNSRFISYGVFLTHIFSAVTVPLWVNLYLTVSNLTF